MVMSLARSCQFRFTLVLRLVWIIVILWFELGVFLYSTATCRWPDSTLTNLSESAQRGRLAADTHVLIIADPQVLDHRSYPGRHPWLVALSQLVVDLNLRKSWRATKFMLKPDAVLFLGDMTDGGRFDMPEAEYEAYYRRFKSIFKIDVSVPLFYLPGNHDIGIGTSLSFSESARARYISHFGALNQKITIGNHTLVLIDAPSLVEENNRWTEFGRKYGSWTAVKGGPVEFVEEFASGERNENSVILFSHIPLSRPDTASCGPLRERGTIRRGAGFGYQNTLGTEASQFLIENIQPSIIFSGDDHDYCEHNHNVSSGGTESKARVVREVTVKSFSMAMGIKRPGFQLLSLSSMGKPGHADRPCILPNQLAIYLSVYIPLTVISLILLFVGNNYQHSRTLPSRERTRSPSTSSNKDVGWPFVTPTSTKQLRARHDVEEQNTPVFTTLPSPDSSEKDDSPASSPTSSFLPAPALSRTNTYQHQRMRSWTTIFALLGKIPVIVTRKGRRAVTRVRRKHGLVSSFLGDVLGVAAVPLGMVVLIGVWMFSDW